MHTYDKLQKSALIVFLILVFCLIATKLYPYILEDRGDWFVYFQPALLEMLSGRSPYTIKDFVYPPWILLLLSPLLLLPPKFAAVFLVTIPPFIYGLIAFKLGAKPVSMGVVIASAPVLWGSIAGNLDWLAAVGLILPVNLGLFFFLFKPQIGIAYTIYIFIEAYRKGGMREVVNTFLPITVVLVLSFVLYGFWPLNALVALDLSWNTSLWPWSIPIGLVLLLISIKWRKADYAISASPFLSPYLGMQSWSVVLLGLVKSTIGTIIASIILWIYAIYRYLQ